MTALEQVFTTARAAGERVFIPFLTAGDPHLAGTERLLAALAAAGARVIEIGFPFSDPIADGPVIQASYTRALAQGLKVEDLFAAIRRVSARPECAQVAWVGMASYSLIHRRGPETFLRQARQAGFSGLIVPDLPLEEAEPLASLAAEIGLNLILLVTPTTPPERAARIASLSTGFLYVVSVTGITGERDRLPPELIEQLERLRALTPLPLCVGFGVSTPDHARGLRDHADGVIVGSALVRWLARVPELGLDRTIDEIDRHARALIAALADGK